MNATAIIIMSVFVALVVLGLVLGIRQSRRQREQTKEFAAARGASYIESDPQLESRLETMDPETIWTARDIVQFGNTRLFSSTSRSRGGRSSSSYGMTCLVDRPASGISARVMITRRVPLVEKMLPQRVADLGSEEFRRGWVVSCSDPEAARRAVTDEVQRALVEHDAGPAWVLTATLTAREAAVETSWAKTAEEWDYLVRLAQRLSRAN